MSQLLQKIKLHKIWSSLIILIILGAGFWVFKKVSAKPATVRYSTQTITKGTITAAISGTGQVAATDQVDIKPQASGTITAVKIKNGDIVKNGDVLITLDNTIAANAVRQAEASVLAAQSAYNKLKSGTAQTDIDSEQLSVTAAQTALEQAQQEYDNTVKQQQLAVATAHGNLLNAGVTAIPSAANTSTASITITGAYANATEGSYTLRVNEGGSGAISYTISGLENTSGWAYRGVAQILGASGLYFTLSTTGNIVPNDYWTIMLPNQQASNYLSLYNSYQSALQNQTQAVNNAKGAIATAQNNLDKAKLTYNKTVTPPTDDDLAASKAQLISAQTQLVTAQENYQHTLITAPFDGVMAKVGVQKGDQATSGTAVATIITQQRVAQISLNEVDAAKVKVGQKATLTFSAIDNLSIAGQVAEIDTLGTITQNVVNFNVKILFDNQDDRVKPGMSVSAAIITDIKQDVLSVPSAAVKANGSQSYVQLLVGSKPEDHMVTTGITSDTDTEISGDIKEGDEVITQTISNTTTAKTTTQTNGLFPGLGGGGARNFGGGATGANRAVTGGGR